MAPFHFIRYSAADRAVHGVLDQVEKLPAGRKAVVAVVDTHGELIALARMDGAPLSSLKLAMNKAYTAARAARTTEELGRKHRHPETGFDIAYFGDDRFVGFGGGVPVWLDGRVAGAVGISGLVEEDDIHLAAWAAAQLEAS